MTTTYDKDECVSILVHGQAKRGKTTLGTTCPPPVLILDADGKGTKFLKKKLGMISWEPKREPVPVPDGTWNHCVVNVSDWTTVTQVYRLLVQHQSQFTSVVIDSISEIQRICKRKVVASGRLDDFRQWGDLLESMRETICGFRDLPETHPTIRCVMMTAESDFDKSNRRVPDLQGAIRRQLPYMVDLLGYLDTVRGVDANGKPGVTQRYLGIGEAREYMSGERVQGTIPDIIYNPNITDMMNQMFFKTQEKSAN